MPRSIVRAKATEDDVEKNATKNATKNAISDAKKKPSGKAPQMSTTKTANKTSKSKNAKMNSGATAAAEVSRLSKASMATQASLTARFKTIAPATKSKATPLRTLATSAKSPAMTKPAPKPAVPVAAVAAPVEPAVNPDAALLAPKTPARSNRGYRPGAVEATKTLAELSDEPIEFKVGDNAVYPGHGVGRVNAIETKEIAGTKLTFYSIQILDSGMKIMVPQMNVKSVGLRPIISKEEAILVVSILKQTDVKIDNQTWNRRYREYMEKIKTGGVREIAEVLRDLFLLKVDKELSFGERKMLDTARSLLIKELILATGRDELMKEAEVKAILDLS
jgi:CarD family transcriptional regulator